MQNQLQSFDLKNNHISWKISLPEKISFHGKNCYLFINFLNCFNTFKYIRWFE
jgi:hypothetical protein